MIDRFGRRIDYLRVSVTDRCNLRCGYCAPPDGTPHLPRAEILTLEEIAEVVRAGAELGIRKVRLTGGEPLLRRGVVNLVRMLARVPGLDELAMTTNGTLLAHLAGPLAAAGLRRVNVSLDAIAPRRYADRTGGGDVRAVLAGIEAARAAGLAPVKLNCVVEESPGEPDARDVAAFAAAGGLDVRFIRRMDLAAGLFRPVHGGSGGDCPRCNRLRLTSNGIIRPCLFSDLGFSVRKLGPRAALEQAVAAKPAAGTACAELSMQQIGG